MWNIIILILYSSLLVCISCLNVSGIDANCRILYTSGYGYNSLFPIPKSSIKEDGSILLHFSVEAASNAHILLSPKRTSLDKDMVYEIVLGAGENSHSAIRKLRAPLSVWVNTSDIMSKYELQDFWIHFDNGVIDVGESGNTKPLVHLEDSNPLDVKYLAFGSWMNVTATWLYDCKQVKRIGGNCRIIHTSGYDYKSFFPIPESSIKEDGSIYLNFSVEAANNAYILLSPKRTGIDKDIVYEIVLAAGKNTQTTISKLRTSLNVSANTSGIMNKNELQDFWIHYDNGIIKLGESGKAEPLLHLEDNSPLEVRYLAFGSWKNVTATWVYDCKHDKRIDANCRILYTSGYGYDSFIPIPESNIKEDGSIYLNFSVEAASNAHILLSPKSTAIDKDIVYEIVLGAGENSHSAIRKLGAPLSVWVNTSDIMSKYEFQDFWIHFDNGVIDVGESAKTKPLVHLKDSNPLDVKYLAFGSWGKVTATWVYDCQHVKRLGENCRIIHTSGYDYKTFFPIPESSIKEDGSILLNVSVEAASNAHILLSPKRTGIDKDIVYEIVLGAGKNTQTTISKLRTSLNVSANTSDIMNRNKLQEFWIHFDNGVIDVGESCSSESLLHLEDNSPLEVKYLAFGSWKNVTATWVYDCKQVKHKVIEKDFQSTYSLWKLLQGKDLYNMEFYHGIDTNCRIIHSSGYGYNSFMPIPGSSIKEDGSIYLNFSVEAASNAHILLSPKRTGIDKDIVYEIVLGAGKNTFSTIRKLRTSISVSATTIGIMNKDELKDFWVHFDNGVIDVGESGKTKPLLHLKDTNPLKVKYLAFGSWTNVTATWVYDCKYVNHTENSLDDLKGMKKLKMTLLEDRDPFILPISHGDETLFISTATEIQYINLDLKKSVLTTHIKFNFNWTDPNLIWDPSDFDNISVIQAFVRQVWRPDFFIFNAIKDISSKTNRDMITLLSDGEVKWSPQLQIITNCNNSDITHWPWDMHSCSIRMGFHQYSVPLNFLPDESISQSKMLLPKVGNEWELVDIIILEEDQENYILTQNGSNTLVINIRLRRHSSPFVYIFLLPIICTAIISQFSYLLPPYCHSRMYIHTISLVIFTIYLLVISSKLPGYAVTNSFLLTFTSRMIALIALQTIISAFIMNIANLSDEYPPSFSVKRLLSNQSVRTVFVLPENESYNVIEENQNTSVGKVQSTWLLFSIILDRIVFLMSTIVIVTPVIMTITN